MRAGTTSSLYLSFILGVICRFLVEISVALLTVAYLAGVCQDAEPHPHRLVAGGAQRPHVGQGDRRLPLDGSARLLRPSRPHVPLHHVDPADDDAVIGGDYDPHGAASAPVLPLGDEDGILLLHAFHATAPPGRGRRSS